MPLQDSCQKFACDLQTCLKVSDYQEWKCQHVLQALFDCCSKIGRDGSATCSGMITASNPKPLVPPLKFSQGKIQPEEPTLLEAGPTILLKQDSPPEKEVKTQGMTPTYLLPTIPPMIASKVDNEDFPGVNNPTCLLPTDPPMIDSKLERERGLTKYKLVMIKSKKEKV